MQYLSTDGLAKPASLLKAFADPVRLRLVNLLAGQDEVCVCHMHEALVLPQPTVSRHLAYLRRNGVVATRKEGLWVYYRLANSSSELHRMLIACVVSCLSNVEVLKSDRERLGRLSSCC